MQGLPIEQLSVRAPVDQHWSIPENIYLFIVTESYITAAFLAALLYLLNHCYARLYLHLMKDILNSI